jgi:hypothetical protein
LFGTISFGVTPVIWKLDSNKQTSFSTWSSIRKKKRKASKKTRNNGEKKMRSERKDVRLRSSTLMRYFLEGVENL